MAAQRRHHPEPFKRRVLRYAQAHTIPEAAQKYALNASMVARWRKQHHELNGEAPRRARSLNGHGQAAALASLELWADETFCTPHVPTDVELHVLNALSILRRGGA
jgi:transposase-like protein